MLARSLHWMDASMTDYEWAIPENIHTQPRTASMFYPPLAFGNSKMRYPPMPSEFHNCEPPPLQNFRFFGSTFSTQQRLYEQTNMNLCLLKAVI